MNWQGGNKRAIGFLRVSSFGQRDNTSRTTQEQAITEYCARIGLQLIKIVHIIETARKSELRTKYKEAGKWAAVNGIQHRVYYKYDREARNLTDNEEGEDDVRTGKYVLHYVLEQKVLHRASPDSDFLMRDYHAVQNKHYSRDLSTKVRTATKTKAEHGWYPGTHTPYGYVHQRLKDEKGRQFRRGTIIIPDPNEKSQKQVLREFELRAQFKSLNEIRRIIIEEGFIPYDEVKKYRATTIDKRLKNKFYVGIFTWQGVEYPGEHELFVPETLFWKVQGTFGIKSPYVRKSGGLFGGGWLKCADETCHCNIVFDPKKKVLMGGSQVKEFRYYHCTNGKKVHQSMKGMAVTEENLWDQLGGAVSRISISEDFAKQIAQALDETKEKAQAAVKRDIAAYRVALEALEGREDRVYEDFTSGLLDKSGYHRQFKKVREERAYYTNLMSKAQLLIHDVHSETSKSILELATNAESLWKLRTPQERKEFLDKLLSNQVLDGVIVRYELKNPFGTLAEMRGNANWRRDVHILRTEAMEWAA